MWLRTRCEVHRPLVNGRILEMYFCRNFLERDHIFRARNGIDQDEPRLLVQFLQFVLSDPDPEARRTRIQDVIVTIQEIRGLTRIALLFGPVPSRCFFFKQYVDEPRHIKYDGLDCNGGWRFWDLENPHSCFLFKFKERGRTLK